MDMSIHRIKNITVERDDIKIKNSPTTYVKRLIIKTERDEVFELILFGDESKNLKINTI